MRKNSVCTEHRARFRAAAVLAVLACLCAAQEPQPKAAPARVPHFSDYPFDRWAAEPERAVIRWEVHLLPPQLSVHERLMARLQVVVPGGELEKRRGRGELVLLARFEDSDGRQWRTGSRLNLANVREGVKSQELTFTVAAFVRPGQYKLQAALLDSRTGEHNFTRRVLRVAAIKGDPLPEAWASLPPVELIQPADGPDGWYLPEVKGLLHLPAGPAEGPPRRVDLLVNLTPSERSFQMASSLRRNMATVIPALKVLSGISAEGKSPSAAVMDLTHQRIVFEAADAARLDWPALSRILNESHPGIIDAKSLAAQGSMRGYFAREVARRAADSGPPRWLIVLSGPLFFGRQEETPPPELPPDPNRHIVYIRFSGGFGGGGGRGGPPPGPPPDVEIAPSARVHGPMPGFGGVLPGGPGRGRGPGGMDPGAPDDLERILRLMGARTFSVTTPEAFRRVLGTLLGEMSVD